VVRKDISIIQMKGMRTMKVNVISTAVRTPFRASFFAAAFVMPPP